MPRNKDSKKQNDQNSAGKRRLVLLDAHAILHRAYHALPEFSSSKGEPTGALYGLSAMIIKIIGELKPDYLAACFDLPEPTYRHEAFADYKAKREKADEALVEQIKKARDVFVAFNIPCLEAPGFEADDLLGTIAEKMRGTDVDIIIASGDMDTLQLVEDGRVRVYTLKRGLSDTVLYDEKKVYERYGFGPKLLPDYKGLAGDPSDNIVGIKGIGEKTATDLIKKFGSIEEIYKTLKKDENKFVASGIKARAVALLKAGEEEARFSKLLATIREDAPNDFSLPEKPWKDSLNMEEVEKLFSRLEFRTMAARVKAVVLGFSGQAKDEDRVPKQESFASTKGISGEEIEQTAIALWLVDSNVTNPDLKDILFFGKTDVFHTAKEKIFKALKERGLTEVFEKIEKPLIPIVERMSRRGIKIDARQLADLSREYGKELSALEKQIFREVGEEFNLNSPKQLGPILFEKLALKLPRIKKTSTGAYTTREEELVKLLDAHPAIPLILKYRGLQKLLSTYIEAIPQYLDEHNRLHPKFLQAGTTTGRMASKDPNIQNIPIKDEAGRRIRKAFVAEKGFRLVAFDYSQIELRIAAFLSGEKAFIDIFRQGEDVHQAVASAVFGVPKEKVDREMRRRAKVINFGILYGMGVLALKQNLGSTKAEAEKFYKDYFEKFSGLAGFIEKVKKDAARKGYTETLFGRRRYFEGINSRIPYVKASAERMAVNAPMQGTQADITKLAMVGADGFIEKEGLRDKVFLILQIHDELVFEMDEGVVASVAPRIRDIMESVVPNEARKGVPIPVNISVGDDWSEMKAL